MPPDRNGVALRTSCLSLLVVFVAFSTQGCKDSNEPSAVGSVTGVATDQDAGLRLEGVANATSDLYRASPTSAAVRIAGGEAEPVYIDGVAHVMVGASLFRVN